jgi:hypothetical protein
MDEKAPEDPAKGDVAELVEEDAGAEPLAEETDAAGHAAPRQEEEGKITEEEEGAENPTAGTQNPDGER